ncbi:unnamed protein product [Peniophora sp. CBMAI 1063]|nr:unnamed protein product [Peniophora sp. CBMAI 1063]
MEDAFLDRNTSPFTTLGLHRLPVGLVREWIFCKLFRQSDKTCGRDQSQTIFAVGPLCAAKDPFYLSTSYTFSPIPASAIPIGLSLGPRTLCPYPSSAINFIRRVDADSRSCAVCSGGLVRYPLQLLRRRRRDEFLHSFLYFTLPTTSCHTVQINLPFTFPAVNECVFAIASTG